jgi:hypothetical protein
VLIKLIGHYFEILSLGSFPGLTVGIIFSMFHVLGKQTVLRHPLYIAVVDLGNKLKTHWRMSLVTLSLPGALFLFIPFLASFTAAGVNSLSSSVLIGSLV